MAVGPDERPLSTRVGGRRTKPSRTLLSGALTLLACGLAMTLSGCGWVSGWFGDDNTPKPQAVPVFKVAVGQCFATPEKVQTEITDLERGALRRAAPAGGLRVVAYQPPAGVQGDAYPGDALLADYADAACARSVRALRRGQLSRTRRCTSPSWCRPPAGWQESDDRAVICFATTTGEELTSTSRGRRW